VLTFFLSMDPIPLREPSERLVPSEKSVGLARSAEDIFFPATDTIYHVEDINQSVEDTSHPIEDNSRITKPSR
jgi:hypothetical protein